MTAILLAFGLSMAPTPVDVHQQPDGTVIIWHHSSMGSKRAKNSWDRLLFSKDEGYDGSMPLVDLRKGGL